MVEKYLASAAAAVLTAAVMAGISTRFLKSEGISAGRKERRLWILTAFFYTGSIFLFEEYGYPFWEKERCYILLCALPVLALTDSRERRIPNRYLLILCVLRLAVLAGEIAGTPEQWTAILTQACAGAAGSFLFMMAAFFLSRKKLGLGDVKLLTVMGLYLGFSLNYMVLFLSLVFAAVWGLWSMWKKKMELKDSIAFAPFLAAGLFAALLLGL